MARHGSCLLFLYMYISSKKSEANVSDSASLASLFSFSPGNALVWNGRIRSHVRAYIQDDGLVSFQRDLIAVCPEL